MFLHSQPFPIGLYPLQGRGGLKPVTASRATGGGHPERTASPSRVSHTDTTTDNFDCVLFTWCSMSWGNQSRRVAPQTTIAYHKLPTFMSVRNKSSFSCHLKKKDVDIQCPPLILAPLINMSKGGCENKSALFILFIFHSKNSQNSNLSLK